MDYPWAVVGQKVVCVKKGQWTRMISGIPSEPGPEFLEVLSIVDVRVGLISNAVEILFSSHNQRTNGVARWFSARRFRPIYPQHRASDIALFEPLLNTTSKPSTVDA